MKMQDFCAINITWPHLNCNLSNILVSIILSKKIVIVQRLNYFIAFNFIDGDDESIKIIYVPSHLYHMLFELFKNAMRATVEHHKTDVLPPLLVTIVKGKEDICVKVSSHM